MTTTSAAARCSADSHDAGASTSEDQAQDHHDGRVATGPRGRHRERRGIPDRVQQHRADGEGGGREHPAERGRDRGAPSPPALTAATRTAAARAGQVAGPQQGGPGVHGRGGGWRVHCACLLDERGRRSGPSVSAVASPTASTPATSPYVNGMNAISATPKAKVAVQT